MTADNRDPVTRLTPAQGFPAELTALSTAQLLTLDSLIRRQLDHELLSSPQGVHPVTLDRHVELVAELDAREITAATMDHHAPARSDRSERTTPSHGCGPRSVAAVAMVRSRSGQPGNPARSPDRQPEQ